MLRAPAGLAGEGLEPHAPVYQYLCAALLEQFQNQSLPKNGPSKLPAHPSLVVFDFDGVFTDNRVYVQQDGTESVSCFRGDSLGTNALKKAGIRTMILSTETNPVVQARAGKMDLEVHSGCGDKGEFLAQFMRDQNIDPSQAIFVGNDVNDLAAMKLVGFPVCPADAHPEVQIMVSLILTIKGGAGCVREICDLLLADTGQR